MKEATEVALGEAFAALLPHLDERQRRLVLGAAARVLGYRPGSGRDSRAGSVLMTSPRRTPRRRCPHGVSDLAADSGWVLVGCDGDTAAFAVATLRRWWNGEGMHRYPAATRLLITADAE